MRSISPRAIRAFRKTIYDYYKKHRRNFPWRRTRNAYRILVSEIMLQQTQTERVMGKYQEFLKAFPNIAALHRAPLFYVLRVWQGLGYNRRAIALKRLAAEVNASIGVLPRDPIELIKLPGVGPATAGAVAAFAYGVPSAFIETNIRTVYLHFFFPRRKNVRDTEIIPLIEATLDRQDPRNWYYALLDYGVMLKKRYGNPNVRSAHYNPQTPFDGSHRQLRGAVVRSLLAGKRLATISREEGKDMGAIRKVITKLKREGFVI